MRKLFAFLLVALLALPATALAATDAQNVEGLRKQVKDLSQRLDEMSGRINKNTIKRAIDRFNWYGDMRVKADTLHYKNVTFNPGIQVDFTDFANKAMNGDFGDPNDATSPLGQMLAANPALATAFQSGQLHGIMPYAFAPKKTYDVNNDILYTTRLRLSFRAKVCEERQIFRPPDYVQELGRLHRRQGLRFLELLHHGRHRRRQYHRRLAAGRAGLFRLARHRRVPLLPLHRAPPLHLRSADSVS